MEYLKSILMECMYLCALLVLVSMHCQMFLLLCNLIFFHVIPHFCSRPGGDKIYNVFDNQLPAALKRLQFDKHLAMENVRKLITQADGYQPHLIAPEQGYRRLIETAVITIKGPAEAAVDAVCILTTDRLYPEFIDFPSFIDGIFYVFF